MNQLLASIVVLVTLVGCASADKPTIPKGKWSLINQKGFVPADVKRYTEGVDVFIDSDDVKDTDELVVGENENGSI